MKGDDILRGNVDILMGCIFSLGTYHMVRLFSVAHIPFGIYSWNHGVQQQYKLIITGIPSQVKDI